MLRYSTWAVCATLALSVRGISASQPAVCIHRIYRRSQIRALVEMCSEQHGSCGFPVCSLSRCNTLITKRRAQLAGGVCRFDLLVLGGSGGTGAERQIPPNPNSRVQERVSLKTHSGMRRRTVDSAARNYVVREGTEGSKGWVR